MIADGCGRHNPVHKYVDENSAPDVFSLQLAWETQTESADAIAGTLEAMVPEEVDLGATCALLLIPCRNCVRLHVGF